MRYIVFVFFFIGSIVLANDQMLEAKIYETIFTSLKKHQKPRIYIDGDVPSLKKYSNELRIVAKCEDADVIVLQQNSSFSCSNSKAIVFGTKYYHLKRADVVGAFFWQKGRPNILFYKSRLKEHNIQLPASMSKYIENER